jgi:adenosine deaminase
MSSAERFRAVPKVELHLHAAGSVRPATMHAFVAADGLPSALADAYAPAATGEGLPAYLTRFAAWDATVLSPERLARVIAELSADLMADGVVYAEVRLRPPTDDDGLWHALIDAVRAARGATTPVLGFIAVMLRGWSADRAEREARRAAAWAGRGVVALDIAGDEAVGGFATLARATRIAREAGLAIATHAGETGGAAAVREALTLLAPDRIAHGVGASADPELVAELRDRQIHLEMAIRSNVQTGTVPEPSSHPFASLLRGGVSVGLNTDNRTISGTTLSDEYALAADALSLGWAELAQATVLAAQATFAPADTKRELVHRVQDAWASHEQAAHTPASRTPASGTPKP